MLKAKAVLLAGLCGSALILASCGDDSSSDVAAVTTTTAATSTTEPSIQSTTEPGAQSTTEPIPETTTTQVAPADPGGADSAEAAIRQYMETTSLGQTGRAWDLLLPPQRALMSRDAFLSCRGSRSFDLLGAEVLDEYPERTSVAGLGEQDSIAVTMKVTLTSNGQELSDTDTFHAYTANDRWYVAADDEGFACAKA